MKTIGIKKITKGILFIFLLGILTNNPYGSLAISPIPTALTPEAESQLLPDCENLEFPSNLYPRYFNTQVECLQLLLKQNPTIYPEGLVTGFYGILTRQAVARFNQLIENVPVPNEKNYFFDYNARKILNTVTGEERLSFIKDLTLANNNLTTTATSTTTRTIIPSTTATTVTTQTTSTVNTTATTLNLTNKTTLTTPPVSITPAEKAETSLSWRAVLNNWITKVVSVFKKSSPNKPVDSNTLPANYGNEIGVPQTPQMPSFLTRILTSLSKVKIFNKSLVKSPEKEIIAFTFPDLGSTGIIDSKNRTIKIQVPNGTDIKALKPRIILSPKASVMPQAEQVTDYSRPVIYTVTAENRSTLSYVVTVTEAPKSNQNTLTGLKVKEYDSTTIIDNQVNVITLTLPIEADLTNLTVILEAAPYASTDPVSGTNLNLNNLKTVTVKAQNDEIRMYGLRVVKQPLVATTTTVTSVPTPVTTNLSLPITNTSLTTVTTVTTKPVTSAPSTTAVTTTAFEPTEQTTSTTPSTVPKITTSTTKAQPVSTGATLPMAPVTTATTMAVSTTTTTKANSTIIINGTSTTSSTQVTRASVTTASTLAGTLQSPPAKPTLPTTPVLKSTLPIGLRDFLTVSWPAILIGLIAVSILELVFVLLKTDVLSNVLGQRITDTKFIDCSLNNPKIKIDLDQKKRLITLSIPNGENVLAKELILTRDPKSRLVSAPKPDDTIKDGDIYVLTSLEGDKVIYTIKIKRV